MASKVNQAKIIVQTSNEIQSIFLFENNLWPFKLMNFCCASFLTYFVNGILLPAIWVLQIYPGGGFKHFLNFHPWGRFPSLYAGVIKLPILGESNNTNLC